MGRTSTWHTAVAEGAVEIIDPQGQSHLRVIHEPKGTKAIWNPAKVGRIPRDAECLIETPWGESVTSSPLKDTPVRRRSAMREVTVGGRRFV